MAITLNTSFSPSESHAAAAPRAEIPFQISLGPTLVQPSVGWLGGEAAEALFPSARPLGDMHGFQLHETSNLLIGTASSFVGPSIADTTRELYTRLLAATEGRPLYRIWNYVPAINHTGNGLENYQAFCVGRSLVFEAAHGSHYRRALPAASAVGSAGDLLTVVFVAGREAPQHFENPEQIAAYDYPREYGARPPSFARATVARFGAKPLIFISGTASIKGHVTIAPASLSAQLDCTLDNLSLIGRAAGLGEHLRAPAATTARHFKIYVRDPADYDQVRTRLEHDLIRPGDHAIYLQADICRAALKLEIEATLIG